MCLLGICQAVLQFISCTKYVELDILKLSKKRDSKSLKAQKYFPKEAKNIYYFKGCTRGQRISMLLRIFMGFYICKLLHYSRMITFQ